MTRTSKRGFRSPLCHSARRGKPARWKWPFNVTPVSLAHRHAWDMGNRSASHLLIAPDTIRPLHPTLVAKAALARASFVGSTGAGDLALADVGTVTSSGSISGPLRALRPLGQQSRCRSYVAERAKWANR